jgi:RNA polymerase sigma-70 factor (ECF subfamily)
MILGFVGILDSDEKKDKLQAIYEKYQGTMLRVAKSIISDHSLAEDAVSDSIMTIIDNLDKITDISSHKTQAYIVIITRSRAINLLNKQKRFIENPIEDLDLPDADSSVLENLTIKESYEKIIECIKSLPESLSDVLYLSAVMGYSPKEIADLLKISYDAVRQRLSRAKAQIKVKLTQEGTYDGKK